MHNTSLHFWIPSTRIERIHQVQQDFFHQNRATFLILKKETEDGKMEALLYCSLLLYIEIKPKVYHYEITVC